MSRESKSDKFFEDQLDGEELLFVFRKHPIVMRKGLIIASIGILLPMLIIMALTFIYANNPDKLPTLTTFYIALVASFVLAAVLMLPSWITWFYSVFIVTDQRFIQITQKGLWKRSVVDIGLSQIQMVNYEVSGFQETLLGFGTIMMQTFVGDLVIHDVHHPAKTQKKLLGILREKGIVANNPPMMQGEADA